jgi:hypothetical protein
LNTEDQSSSQKIDNQKEISQNCLNKSLGNQSIMQEHRIGSGESFIGIQPQEIGPLRESYEREKLLTRMNTKRIEESMKEALKMVSMTNTDCDSESETDQLLKSLFGGKVDLRQLDKRD